MSASPDTRAAVRALRKSAKAAADSHHGHCAVTGAHLARVLDRLEQLEREAAAAQEMLADAAAQDAEMDRLRAALKPFADAFGEPFAHSYRNADPKFIEFLDRNTITPSMTMGAFRRAAEVMGAQPGADLAATVKAREHEKSQAVEVDIETGEPTRQIGN